MKKSHRFSVKVSALGIAQLYLNPISVDEDNHYCVGPTFTRGDLDKHFDYLKDELDRAREEARELLK